MRVALGLPAGISDGPGAACWDLPTHWVWKPSCPLDAKSALRDGAHSIPQIPRSRQMQHILLDGTSMGSSAAPRAPESRREDANQGAC
jgi:hypothetical protein